MIQYAAICKVDFDDDKGVVEHEIYVKAVDKNDCENTCKYYWLLNRPEVSYYGMKSCKPI